MVQSWAAIPNAEVDAAEHRARLDKFALESDRMLFVAHSQGNLFMNKAYEYANKTMPEKSLAAVHIAPASTKLNGHHILADIDLVINGLRLTDGLPVPSVTRWGVPGYLLRKPGLNDDKDWLGHGLLEIYLNPSLTIGADTNNAIQTSLKQLVATPPKAKAGFFTIGIKWDGEGDVDLHVKEPDEEHVWYANKIGHSGELDVDNTQGYGPEHYYASCDLNKIQVGQYDLGVVNYAGADGRQVLVSIHDQIFGHLGRYHYTMGEEQRDDVKYQLSIQVTQKSNPQRSFFTPSMADYDIKIVSKP
jgi:hypothetical protein